MYYIYIVTNKSNSTIYIGVTSDIIKRIYAHKNKLADGFTKKYNCNKLVYYELFEDPESAIAREKQLKKWRRDKKDFLIEQLNPTWKDLYEEII